MLWKQIAWICRYTSLRPDDVMDMTQWQYKIFTTRLKEMLEAESGKNGG